jgi:hypothetical protein
MKYVYQNGKVKEELSQWADGKDLVLTGYFFFDRGGKHQKSREGMLRSILNQVLSTRRDLIRKVFGQFFGDKAPLPQRFTSWTYLSGAFILMLDHLQDSKICVFLDGLDEYRMIDRVDEYTEEEMDLIYDGTNDDDAWGRSTWITDGHREIAQFLRQFKNRGNVKVCISSRELVVFEQEFRNFPRLQVHEHTAESIMQYCEGRLIDEAPNLMGRVDFVSLITGKSRGVFLWVHLVIDMLVDGNTDGNSKEELLKALDSLPPRLGGKDGLYMRMMQNIKRNYLPESKRLFQLVMKWTNSDLLGPFDIITLFLAEPGHFEADNVELRARNDEVVLKSWEESRPRWTDLQRRLKSRCGGLLEGTENVQFMHQTAKEFMSRSYLWDEIFHSYAGFVGESELNLALLSGLIRRLKCCGEAALKSDTVQDLEVFNGPPEIGNEIPDPYGKLEIPRRGSELLESAIGCATNISRDNDHLNHYVVLLDERDNAGHQLIKNRKEGLPESFRRSHTANASWVEVFYRSEDPPANSDSLKIKNFLELAITTGRLLPYVEAKIRGKGVPRPQLQSLLLRATRRLSIEVRPQEITWFGYLDPKISELLLQEGADPNCRDAESNVAMASEEGRTAWTGLLQDGVINYSHSWSRTVKVFLKYGANPTVRWYKPHDKEDRQAIDIATPETIISAVLANKPERKEDLAEIMELLHKAKANVGAAE